MKLTSFLFAAMAIASHAAPIELTASTDGRGTVENSGITADVSKANLVLRKDGRLSLGLVGKDDYQIKGRWQPADGDSVSFQITDFSEREARGTGRIDLRQRRDGVFELMKVSLAAKTDNGRPITARFTVDRQPLPPPPPVRPAVILDDERNGRGIFRTGGQKPSTFRKVHVTLYKNGKAHVHTEGTAELRYDGTWADGGPGTATLDVRGGIKGERLRGATRYRGGHVGRVELSGTVDGRYYSIEFDPVD
jgi:hypothetical protein